MLAAPATGRAERSWEFGPSVLLYVLRDQPSYLQPNLTVDHKVLHLEGRYNYEEHDTGSALVGGNLSFGHDLELRLTPMLGVSFGRLNSVLLGLTSSLEWGPLSLSAQGEYALDVADVASSFFYSWDELSLSQDWLRIGVALQRTRVFHTSTEIQVGPLLEVTIWKIAASAYLFAPGQESQFLVLGIGASL